MSFNSGKFSGSTLRGAFKRLFSRKEKGADKLETEFENNQGDRVTPGSVRNLESSGYVRYSVSSGSEVFVSLSDNEPFIDHDEPKPMRREGRFLRKMSEERSSVSEDCVFRGEVWSPMTPQAAATSSEDVGAVVSYDSESLSFEDEPLYESVPFECENYSYPEEKVMMDVERLPAAPAFEQSGASSKYEESEAEIMAEGSEEEEQVSEPVIQKPFVSRYREIASPKVMLALPPYTEYSVFMEPPHVILLNEAHSIVSDEHISAQNQGVPGWMYTSSLPSISNVGEIEPIVNESSSGYDVVSVDTEGQVSETSSSMEEKFVDYADFVGYDFLPEITEPVRREPREHEPTISKMPEYVEIGDEISGMMMLTVPELASDAFEAIDAYVTIPREIPDDGMEELCIAIDDAKNNIIPLVEVEQVDTEEVATTSEAIQEEMRISEVDNEGLITEAVEIFFEHHSIGYEDRIETEVRAETVESDVSFEDILLNSELELQTATQESHADVEDSSSEEEEIMKTRPKISFTFGKNRKVRSFY